MPDKAPGHLMRLSLLLMILPKPSAACWRCTTAALSPRPACGQQIRNKISRSFITLLTKRIMRPLSLYLLCLILLCVEGCASTRPGNNGTQPTYQQPTFTTDLHYANFSFSSGGLSTPI